MNANPKTSRGTRHEKPGGGGSGPSRGIAPETSPPLTREENQKALAAAKHPPNCAFMVKRRACKQCGSLYITVGPGPALCPACNKTHGRTAQGWAVPDFATCERCGEQFSPSRDGQKRCPLCSQSQTCTECGNEFQTRTNGARTSEEADAGLCSACLTVYRRHRELERVWHNFAAPERYENADLQKCAVDDDNIHAVQACLQAADSGRSLYLHGPYGVGKTFLSVAVVKARLARWHDVTLTDIPRCAFLRETALAGEVRTTYSGGIGTEASILQRYCDSDILVIDDICQGADRDLERQGFRLTLLDRLVDARWNNGRQTIITSSFGPKALVDKTDGFGLGHLASRILGLCGKQGILHLGGRDRRLDS